LSISSHARCDNCERKLIPLDDVTVSEDYLMDSGWVCVKWTEGDEDSRMDETKDFCGFACAGRWCAKEACDGEETPRVQEGRADS
jgi:hypothetical protein